MAAQEKVQIRYAPSRAYVNTQNNYVGAQRVAGRRGTLPTFTDLNTKYVAKTGDDGAAGTAAAPYLTFTFALSQLAGAFFYVVGLDSETYRERPSINYTLATAGGLYAADGQAPTIYYGRGHDLNTLGPRLTGRTKFSAGAYPATFLFVSKAGNDGTGARGNPALPFLTIQAALNDGARIAGDTVQIDDSGYYDDGAITVTANAVTLQAKDGFTPTCVLTGAATQLFLVDVGFCIYGITMYGRRTQGAGNGLILIRNNVAGAFECYDCSFRYHAFAIETEATFDAAMDVRNCYFYDCNYGAINCTVDVQRAITVQNCFFDRCGSVAPTVGTIVIIGTAAAPFVDCTVEDCTFLNCDGPANVEFTSLHPHGNVGAGDSIVRSCAFIMERPTPWDRDPYHITHGVWCEQGDVGDTLLIENCSFDRMGGSAVRVSENVVLAGPTAVTVRGCVATYCGARQAAGAASFWFKLPLGILVDSCTAIGAYNGSGFRFDNDAGASTRTINHSVAINCEEYGFVDYNTGADINGVMEACAEYGSGLEVGYYQVGVGIVGMTIWFCCMDSGYTAPFVSEPLRLEADPQFMSTTIGSENAALSPASPCVLGGGSGTIYNIGLEYPLIEITGTTSAFTIDGFQLQGDLNFTDGVWLDQGLASLLTLQYCTLSDTAVTGIMARSNIAVTKCSLEECNGFGIELAHVEGSVVRNVGYKCQSSFIVVEGTSLEIENNTAYGCAYGQYDESSITSRSYKNNVYSESGNEDYHGDEVQRYSAIGVLSAEATIDANGTRLNPLFRNVGGGDLRLQTVEEGYPFNSPAKGGADDADDMGAISFTYGALVETWTLIDFDTGTPPAEYRNPDELIRGKVPVILAQRDLYSGDLRSDAQAFQREWVLQWGASNDMPAAQVLDIVTLYETGDGECQISFDDGVTWIPVRINRKKPLSWTEIEGLGYTDDTIATPIGEITFQESA